MKKKFIGAMVIAVALAFGLVGCASDDNSNQSANDDAVEMVSITHDLGTVEVPFDPERIAMLDLAACDVLDGLGEGDRIVGLAKGSTVDYLQKYVDDDSIANLGNLKEVDMEALMESEPDVIFIGGRLRDQYDEISKVAPTILITTDTEIGVVESTTVNATNVAKLFGLEDEVAKLTADFDDRIDVLKAAAEGQNCVMGMVTSGNFNTLGDDGRCSLIPNEIGFENLAAGDVTATHGDSASFELLVQLNPNYIFVLDRDSAIETDGAEAAQEVMENALVAETTAYQDGQIVYLTPSVWYLAEGGITALDIMISDIEKGIL